MFFKYTTKVIFRVSRRRPNLKARVDDVRPSTNFAGFRVLRPIQTERPLKTTAGDRELSNQVTREKDIERYQFYYVQENFETTRSLVTQSVRERYEY